MPKAPKRFTIGPTPERKPWANNNAHKRKITGRALQRERARLFAENPLCVECQRNGRISVATIRDHTLALAFGGEDTRENTQGLCQACSDAKSKDEARRGRQ